MCTFFISLSQLPFKGRKFRDSITKTAFRSYPSSRSSINKQCISFVAVQAVEQTSYGSGWQERPHNITGDRKGLIRFWVTGKNS